MGTEPDNSMQQSAILYICTYFVHQDFGLGMQVIDYIQNFSCIGQDHSFLLPEKQNKFSQLLCLRTVEV